MKLLDIVNRLSIPEPWSEGNNIPWHDPDFSERMLQEHLSQEHDAASRRLETVNHQVQWIHHRLLAGCPSRILDLGCGPGLYTSRLAKLGHECVGIDYSPASIAHARQQSREEKLRCIYLHQDIRAADYGSNFGMIMLLFGEFNVFRPADARLILNKAYRALAPSGLLLLEPHVFSTIQRVGELPPSWHSSEGGLFSASPHLYLQESFWNPDSRTMAIRYFILDAYTGEVDLYAQSMQAYTDEQYRSILAESGFEQVEFYPSLTGSKDEGDLFVVIGRKFGG